MSGSISHDKGDQPQKVQQGLIPGEQIVAVHDCTGAGTGFVGVTNFRVIVQNNSFVGGKSAVTSLPLRSTGAVSFVSDTSMFGKLASSATVAIASGSTVREATFRGEDKAEHIHDTILWLVTQTRDEGERARSLIGSSSSAVALADAA